MSNYRAIDQVASLCRAVARRCRAIANSVPPPRVAWLAASAAAQTRTLVFFCAMRQARAVAHQMRLRERHRGHRCCDAQEIIGVAKISAGCRRGVRTGGFWSAGNLLIL
ncbi:hypothetical protein ABIF38_005778 [Bradyrhizobium japonicum]|uniref:hypothetical protein n=1 Tax=Bradyrhizobium TaxID=374 RepID=UPI001020A9CA|nr:MULTISPECIES: hypothetical protein [Bradyrhizobium]MBP2434850.1 hypothetical protein [Bradyrhizobium elkanii]MCP1731914.1 hypothetical protein [Bradyrhizobium elkanii]MCP1932713.1 hypothetical protein [Bradyrhizobium elkanii]MCP1969048.1 hypothetical protein [Bradyrhizobium elkanii]MCS3479274.1 hypothetical protein [Bradyrhizobium elkanii]